jgi:hypothetical protein
MYMTQRQNHFALLGRNWLAILNRFALSVIVTTSGELACASQKQKETRVLSMDRVVQRKPVFQRTAENEHRPRRQSTVGFKEDTF